MPSRCWEWKIPNWYQWEALGCQARETLSCLFHTLLYCGCVVFALKKKKGGKSAYSSARLWQTQFFVVVELRSSSLAGCKLRAVLFLEATARPHPWCLLPSPKLARDAECLSHFLFFFSIYLFIWLCWVFVVFSFIEELLCAKQNPQYFMYVIILGLPDSFVRWTSFLFSRWRNQEWGSFSPGTRARR